MARPALGVDRDEAARRVMLAIASGPVEIDLAYVAPDGSRPLVVTTPNEYLSAVIERVEALGGSANVALAEAKTFSIFTIQRSGNARPGVDELNSDLSMGMFVLKARARRSRRGNFQLKDSGSSISIPTGEFAYA